MHATVGSALFEVLAYKLKRWPKTAKIITFILIFGSKVPSKPIILGEPSEIGEFADIFGFPEDPPDFKVI